MNFLDNLNIDEYSDEELFDLIDLQPLPSSINHYPAQGEIWKREDIEEKTERLKSVMIKKVNIYFLQRYTTDEIKVNKSYAMSIEKIDNFFDVALNRIYYKIDEVVKIHRERNEIKKNEQLVHKVETKIKSPKEEKSPRETPKKKMEELYILYQKDLNTALTDEERKQKKQMYRELFELLLDNEEEETVVISMVSDEPTLDDIEKKGMVPNSYLDKTEQLEGTVNKSMGSVIGTVDNPLNEMRDFLVQNVQRNEILHNPKVYSFDGHPVINQPQQPYKIVSNAEYTKGTLNPIYRQITKKVVNFDSIFCHSQFKETDSTSSFIYKLPEPLNNVVSMRLASAEIPNTWYLFDEYLRSNEMIIRVYIPQVVQADIGLHQTTPYGNELQEFRIKIPHGTWDIQELKPVINKFIKDNRYTQVLDTVKRYNNLAVLFFDINETDSRTNFRFRSEDELEGSATDDSVNNGTYIPLYNPVAKPNEYQASLLAYFEIDFRIPEDPDRDIRKNLGWSLGFRKPYYKVFRYDNPYRLFYDFNDTSYNIIDPVGTTYKGTLQSEAVYGANKFNYLFLSVNDFVGNHSQDIVSCFENNLMTTDILARIAVRYGSFTVNIDDSSDLVHRDRKYFGPVTIEKIEVKLLDKFGELINLNGSDYSLVLEFMIAYS
jgi:hypothetical protein